MQDSRMGNVPFPVADLDAAVAFYRDALGLPVKVRDGDRFAALDAGGVVLALVCGPESVTGGTPAASFLVDDLDKPCGSRQPVEPWSRSRPRQVRTRYASC